MVTNDYLCITDCLKATPAEEGGQRYVYLEASNETLDFQQEVVLAKALRDSADYYLKYGNFDIDHITLIGVKQGIPDYQLYEIGQPEDVRVQGRQTFVKGRIYQGDGDAAERANQFWSSLTELRPPARWYPSVGGQIMGREKTLDPDSGQEHSVVTKVRWTNIGFSRTPVNPGVPTVSTVPLGALAKSFLGGGGFDLTKAEGLVAGYGTDAASLSGGAALRQQSLDHRLHSYWAARDWLAKRVLGKGGAQYLRHPHQLVNQIAGHCAGTAQAADWVQRFINDVKRGRKQ